MTIVDTNVLLDLTTDDPVWFDWSAKHLEVASTVGPLLINDVVYAEISSRYERMADVDDLLRRAGVSVAATPRVALFMAGKVFAAYRRAGGTRGSLLPDFFIGAHAAVAGMALMTRDPRRYRTYFPDVLLITPGDG